MFSQASLQVCTKPTSFMGEQIQSAHVYNINPTRGLILCLGIVHEAEVNHAQLLNVFHVDWQNTKLIGNERHKLHDVVYLQ